jgi:hypothetical protein
MTVLTPTYGLSQGDLVAARVRAENSIGFGDWSEANLVGATVIAKPHQMSTPTLGSAISLT